jgi:hypothetical protein
MACRTWPQSGWPPAPPGCGRRTPAWTTRLRRSVPPADTRQWLAGWRTWRTSRASGRPDIPVQCDRPAMGTDPVRTAAAKRRTPPAPSVRPCVWPPGHGQPRGVHVLALTGQDGNAHAPFGQPQQLPASGPVRRDHLHPMLDAGTSASPVPVRCPRGRVRRPRWTPRSDRLPDTACPVVSGRTPSTPPGTPWQTGSDADREQTNGTEGTRISSIATTTRRPAGTRRAPSCGAGVCSLATKVGSAMARLPARP